MYPHTAVQMSRLRNLLTEGFPVAGPAGDFPAGALAAGFGGAATAAALGEAAGRASSGFAIINLFRLSGLILFPQSRTPPSRAEKRNIVNAGAICQELRDKKLTNAARADVAVLEVLS